jgi:hypothetical protein
MYSSGSPRRPLTEALGLMSKIYFISVALILLGLQECPLIFLSLTARNIDKALN